MRSDYILIYGVLTMVFFAYLPYPFYAIWVQRRELRGDEFRRLSPVYPLVALFLGFFFSEGSSVFAITCFIAVPCLSIWDCYRASRSGHSQIESYSTVSLFFSAILVASMIYFWRDQVRIEQRLREHPELLDQDPDTW